MDSLAEEIAKMEYQRLSAEITSIQQENNQVARYAVIACVAICGVIVSQQALIRSYYNVLKFLPFAISILFSFRVFSLYKRVELISSFLEEQYETQILKKNFPGLGWESRLNENIRKAKPSRSFAQASAILFWSTLDLLSLIFIFIAPALPLIKRAD